MADELLDVVTDKDIVIKQEMRSVVHRLGLQHRGVHVFLFTVEGKLLVQQRSRHKEASPLALDCSVSEHLKSGERYRSGARRGLEEELGLHDIHIHPLVKFRMNYGPHDNEICQLFEGRVDPALVHFDPLEVEATICLSLDELEALLCARKSSFCGWFVQLLNWYAGKPSDLKILRIYSRNRPLFPAGSGRR